MTTFANDQERFDWIRENVYVPVVSDILDDLGRKDQAMHHRLRPLDADNCTIVGRARTLRWMQTDYVVEEDPYGNEIDAIDSLRPGDVVVHATDYSGTIAPWGELMTTVCMVRGAVGCVCDALVRDCKRIMAMGFPVFHGGIGPLDSKGRGLVVAYDVPIRCGEVLVNAGDLVFADFDGIVVVPQDVEEQVLAQAMDKVGKENLTRKELKEGKTLREVYSKYRVL